MDDFRATSLQNWSTVAPDWGELTAWVDYQLAPATDWMIGAVALQPGERVLELAGGPGTLSLRAARAVGPEGHVIYSDFAAPMVEVARDRLAAEGDPAIECRVIDAEAIDLPDGAVDVVLCRMGYMLMADPALALSESARVLAPGGRLALSVWSDADENPWAALPAKTIRNHLDAAPPPPDAPGQWSLADAARLRRLLEDAGLDSIQIERLDKILEYRSFEHWFETASRLAGPVRTMLAGLEASDRAAIQQNLRDAAKPYEQEGGGLSIPERMVVASARRP